MQNVEIYSNFIPLVANPNETFSYDSVGNRLNRDTQTTNSTFDAGNRLLSDANFNYTYDNNGNMTSKTNIITNQTISFVYDAENQLIQINLSNGDVANYKYDGLGRRIEKTLTPAVGLPNTQRYIYDNEDIAFEFDGSNVLQATYVHGPGIDEPLAMKRGGSDYFYHTDGLGSITDLTDTAGIIAQSYVYDSFGNIITQTGSLTNPYTYTGRELDSESGLYYYRARYYDPTVGRFLTEDPIGFENEEYNKFLYVNNNPIIYMDPTGFEEWYKFWGGEEDCNGETDDCKTLRNKRNDLLLPIALRTLEKERRKILGLETDDGHDERIRRLVNRVKKCNNIIKNKCKRKKKKKCTGSSNNSPNKNNPLNPFSPMIPIAPNPAPFL